MKLYSKSIVILSTSIGLLAGNIHSDSLKVPQASFPISSVQVYRSQALITRSSIIHLRKGINVISLKKLPVGLIDSSVKIKIKGDKNSTIREIRTETIHIESFATKKAIEADHLLQQSENELKEKTQQYKLLKAEEAFLLNLDFGKTDKKNYKQNYPIRVSSWKSTLNFKKKALEKNHIKLTRILTKIDTARDNLSIALSVAKKYKNQQRKKIKEVYISIESKKKKDVHFSLLYRIKGAYWYPIYSSRVTSKGRHKSNVSVNIATFALVKNETGENWSRSRLSFSASDPSRHVSLLELGSWRIKPVEREVINSKTRYRKRHSQNEIQQDSSFNLGKKSYRKRKRKMRPIQKPKYKRMAKKDERVKKELQARLNQARGYYTRNKAAFGSRARSRSSKIKGGILKDYFSNTVMRDHAQKRGDFQSSLQLNNEILENIENIPQRFQKFFHEDKSKALKEKATSLRMIENQKYIGNLRKPTLNSPGFDFKFKAPSKETILADGSFHKIFIKEDVYTASLSHESSPLKSRYTFLIGTMKNKGRAPILAGPVSIFYKNNYIGESRLGNIYKGRSFSLNLGNDENIKTTRITKSFRISEGIFTKKFNFKKEVIIEIKNINNYAIKLNLFDRIPFSTDEKVIINSIKVSPSPYKVNKESNLFQFQLHLKKRSKKKIHIKYNLLHPKGFLPVFRTDGSLKW